MKERCDLRVVLVDQRSGGHNVQHVGYLADYLLEEGCDVTFLTTEIDDNAALLPTESNQFRVELLDQPSLSEISWLSKRQLVAYRVIKTGLEFAAKQRADIIHLMSINRLEIPLFLALQLHTQDYPKNAFATLVAPYYREGGLSVTSLPTHFHEFNRRALARSLRQGELSRTFVLAPQTEDWFQEQYPSFPIEKVRSVPDPIKPVSNEIGHDAARRNLSLPTNLSLILFFGKLRREKGSDILLEAINDFPSDVGVVFAGPPGSVTSSDIKRVKTSLSNPNRIVERLQFIPNDEVHDYFRSADVVILPYRSEYDGTSGVLQHAAATGTPVLATDAGHVGHLVDKWDLGTVVEPDSPSAVADGVRTLFTGGVPDVSGKAEAYVDAHHWRRWASGIYEEYLTADKTDQQTERRNKQESGQQ